MKSILAFFFLLVVALFPPLATTIITLSTTLETRKYDSIFRLAYRRFCFLATIKRILIILLNAMKFMDCTAQHAMKKEDAQSALVYTRARAISCTIASFDGIFFGTISSHLHDDRKYGDNFPICKSVHYFYSSKLKTLEMWPGYLVQKQGPKSN